MIILNSRKRGMRKYTVTIGNGTDCPCLFTAYAPNEWNAVNLVADHLVSENATNIYYEFAELVAISGCTPKYKHEANVKKRVKEFADDNSLTECGTNGIYLEITSVKGCPNG